MCYSTRTYAVAHGHIAYEYYVYVSFSCLFKNDNMFECIHLYMKWNRRTCIRRNPKSFPAYISKNLKAHRHAQATCAGEPLTQRNR